MVQLKGLPAGAPELGSKRLHGVLHGWAWRFEDVMTGSATPVVETTMFVLTYTAPISIISFIITLVLCMPAARNHDS